MKKIILILLSVFTFGALHSQDTLENSLLWEITGNDLKSPSYLYGTIHIIGKDDFFLTDSTKITFKAAKQLALEIDINEMNNPFQMMGMMRGMLMDDGVTLKDLLKADEYKVVHNYILDSMGMPSFFAGMLEKVKPMFLSEMVGMDMSSIGEDNPMSGDGGTVSYEMEFAEMAKEQDMKVFGLETIAYQMSIFDSIPYKDQAYMLLDAIQNGGEEEAMVLDEMVEMYKNQDLNGLNAMINGSEDLSGFTEILLVNRNKNWIPVIGKAARKKPTFFAVGAGHLPGEQGVIKLLRKAGYTVRAVK